MAKRFYFDTSIWLDFLEKRDEPGLPKGTWAKKLIEKIIKNKDKIVLSEVIKNELIGLGYSRYELESIFFPFQKILISVYSNKKQFGKAKDLSDKRNIPLFDALHAILARDNRSILITRDKHFDKLLDIISYKKPEGVI